MKLFLITFSAVTVLFLAVLYWISRGKPVITLEFDAFENNRTVILEAENADGTKMSLEEAERILKEGKKCEIIFSEDDGVDRSDYSFGGHEKWSFF